MTLSQVLIDTTAIDQLSEGMLGFSDDAQELLSQTEMTTLFISGASSTSNGRCAYLLMDDGSRLTCAFLFIGHQIRSSTFDLLFINAPTASSRPCSSTQRP